MAAVAFADEAPVTAPAGAPAAVPAEPVGVGPTAAGPELLGN